MTASGHVDIRMGQCVFPLASGIMREKHLKLRSEDISYCFKQLNESYNFKSSKEQSIYIERRIYRNKARLLTVILIDNITLASPKNAISLKSREYTIII